MSRLRTSDFVPCGQVWLAADMYGHPEVVPFLTPVEEVDGTVVFCHPDDGREVRDLLARLGENEDVGQALTRLRRQPSTLRGLVPSTNEGGNRRLSRRDYRRPSKALVEALGLLGASGGGYRRGWLMSRENTEQSDITAERLAHAIGRVFDREDQAMRSRGYSSLGPQVDIFDAFAKHREKGLHLAAEVLHELRRS